MKQNDRRWKMVNVPPEWIVTMLALDGIWPAVMVRLSTTIPDDARVEDCYYSPEDRCLKIRIHSASFDPVPDGMWKPSLQVAFVEDRPELVPAADYHRIKRQNAMLTEMLLNAGQAHADVPHIKEMP